MTSPEEHLMHLHLWVWIATIGALAALLAVDLWQGIRSPHEIKMREAAVWVSAIVGLTVLFGAGLWYFTDARFGHEFFAGWITEYSLSVDNLFVFVIILTRLRVPRHLQQHALMAGILLALVLRGLFILAGAALIERFTWLFYFFGAFLVVTAINLVRSRGAEEAEYQENALIRRIRSVLPISTEFSGARLRVRENGRRLWTPMLVVLLALGTTDLIFALDSIPAIFGLTREPFVVFTANVFALMGLRQLYFLLGGLLERLVYLSAGLAAILGFIGVKLVLEALHDNNLPFINGGEPIAAVPAIPIWLSLTVILGTLVVATVASLVKTRGRGTPAESAEGLR
jgi:tellurite resistance protein TerC